LRALIWLENDPAISTTVKQAVDGFPPNAEVKSVKWSYLLRWKSNAPDAVRDLEETWRSDKKNAELCSAYGRALYLTGKAEEGFKLMRTACDIAPKSLLCSFNLADSYTSKLDDLSALAILDLAVEHNPKSPAPLIKRGRLREQQGRYKEALTDYMKAISISPQCSVAYYCRAHLNSYLGNYQISLSDSEKALKADETHLLYTKILRLLIIGARKTNQVQKALTYEESLFKQVVKYSVVDKATQADLLEMARDYEATKQYKQALKVTSRLQQFDPNNTTVALLAARLYEESGQYPLALQKLDWLIKRDPTIPEWHTSRAKVLSQMGRQAEAAKDREEANKLAAQR
jgi:tetratricopeptide (TPR) repeat protein